MKNKKVPIVFSFNDTWYIPAGVCITSLLENATEGTFYDIFVLFVSDRLSLDIQNNIMRLKERYNNFDISFINLDTYFKDENPYEVRNITKEAYFRLLIPILIKGYDKVIYSDVDVIFTGDYSHLLNTNMKGKALGAVKMVNSNIGNRYYIQNILKLDVKDYFSSSFLIFNMQKEVNVKKVQSFIKKKYLFQDQDIVNIIYKGDILSLSDEYAGVLYNILQKVSKLSDSMRYHYSGPKPWVKNIPFGDIWWKYYRISIFYESEKDIEYQQKINMSINPLSGLLGKLYNSLFFLRLRALRGLLLIVLKYKFRKL